MFIRNAMPADASGIATLAAELGYPADTETILERLSLLAAHEHHDLLVAISDSGAMLGWLEIVIQHSITSGRRAEIIGLVVASSARQQGIGKQLNAAAEAWARERRLDLMVVRSNVQRQASHAFYTTLGYKVSKTQTVYNKAL